MNLFGQGWLADRTPHTRSTSARPDGDVFCCGLSGSCLISLRPCTERWLRCLLCPSASDELPTTDSRSHKIVPSPVNFLGISANGLPPTGLIYLEILRVVRGGLCHRGKRSCPIYIVSIQTYFWEFQENPATTGERYLLSIERAKTGAWNFKTANFTRYYTTPVASKFPGAFLGTMIPLVSRPASSGPGFQQCTTGDICFTIFSAAALSSVSTWYLVWRIFVNHLTQPHHKSKS